MKKSKLFKIIVIIIVLIFSLNILINNNSTSTSSINSVFDLAIIDSNGPVESWAKNIGDINGDGLNDIIIGGHGKVRKSFLDKVIFKFWSESDANLFTGLVWYENPEWNKHVITQDYSVSADVEIADINNDGLNDIILLSKKGLFWLENPQWSSIKLSSKKFHDIEVYDLNGDGDKEIVARNQSLFGYNNGDSVHVFYKLSNDNWDERVLPVPHGEGLVVRDINDDGFADIIVNNVWLRNPGATNKKQWESLIYAENWDWNDVKIQVADINGDKKEDIILVPSEPINGKYRISWFESTTINSTISWQEHIIAPNVATVYHSLAAEDFDNDGDIDLLTAKMNQGSDSHVVLFLNEGEGKVWKKQIINNAGLHNIVAGDIDGDYDIDFIGTNWQNADRNKNYPVQLWINKSNNKHWDKVTVDDSLSLNTLFVFTSDIDNDGDKDILTGNFIFRNTGKPNFRFIRERLNNTNNNISNVYDYDHDGDDDLLISNWQGYNNQPDFLKKILLKLKIIDKQNLKGNMFQVAINNGSGVFNDIQILPDSKGDFLQGSNNISIDGSEHIILSWHKPGYGVQAYKIPNLSHKEQWTWQKLSEISQDEALSVADIDIDGDDDILLGTKWLRNEGGGKFKAFNLISSNDKPDRNVLKDINNDNRVDAIVGYEAINKLGKIAWYEQGLDPIKNWTEHEITKIIGPMSLDVGDIDLDGDMDIVAGEHNLKYPQLSRVFILYNNLNIGREWGINVINVGNEHHDGTQLFDYDNDGDLDIISIGWTHSSLNLYINPLN